MRVRSFFIILIFLFFNFFHFNKAHSHLLCEVSLSSPESDFLGDAFLSPTERLIAYLNQLLEKGIMTDDLLSDFISGLEEDELINPFQREKGSVAEIQGEGIQEYIEQSLDQVRLLVWAKKKREERITVRVKRTEVHQDTQTLNQKIEFHPVQPGRVQAESFLIQLTYPIEVMSTPVTQKHWVDLMGENPAYFAQGEDSVLMRLNGHLVELQPDHPIENITLWSILIFANRLSERDGLTPTYDLSEVEWDPNTRAENGTLKAKGDLAEIKSLVRVNALGGIYREGYRLPTRREQEYLLRAARDAQGRPFWKTEIGDHAWHGDNSNGKNQPVADLKPLILDGSKFYDLYGNVCEWAWDWSKFQGKGVQFVNPELVPVSCPGGVRKTLKLSIHSRDPSHSSTSLGLRLVRTIGSWRGNGKK